MRSDGFSLLGCNENFLTGFSYQSQTYSIYFFVMGNKGDTGNVHVEKNISSLLILSHGGIEIRHPGQTAILSAF